MGGIVSANVLIVAPRKLHSPCRPARAFGFPRSRLGIRRDFSAAALLASQLPQRLRLTLYGPFPRRPPPSATSLCPFLYICRRRRFSFPNTFSDSSGALSGVVAQATLMSIVPRHFMGRTPIRHGHPHHYLFKSL